MRGLRDTQCGFKAFRRKAATAVFSRSRVNGFDIDALLIAGRLGLHILQIPVDATFPPGSTYSVRRHLLPFLPDIIRVKRWEMHGVYHVRDFR